MTQEPAVTVTGFLGGMLVWCAGSPLAEATIEGDKKLQYCGTKSISHISKFKTQWFGTLDIIMYFMLRRKESEI